MVCTFKKGRLFDKLKNDIFDITTKMLYNYSVINYRLNVYFINQGKLI